MMKTLLLNTLVFSKKHNNRGTHVYNSTPLVVFETSLQVSRKTQRARKAF